MEDRGEECVGLSIHTKIDTPTITLAHTIIEMMQTERKGLRGAARAQAEQTKGGENQADDDRHSRRH